MARSDARVKLVTANRLTDGIVVWLAERDRWVEVAAEAAVFEGPDAEAALGRAKLAERDCVVVEPYLIDAIVEAGRPQPTRYREQIRARGPSIRLDLGKQATA